ncbi:hypothetical protein [Polyangium mundeleinium]|uniref:Outer membrane protein beta-barrel domain-containing protein n=1 Tax=Polyangium mundeleinium TaxID=2995306 RepID=A0ABT5F6W0_9BACT|nr:hypothetical protein [Polyangium mundeleinium]MDC0749118.1 hypothetical protein [Polyangium mundeleinium]
MKTRTTHRLLAAGLAAAGAFVAYSPDAHAVDWVIKNPSQHPAYRAELEPHANFILFRRGYGIGRYGSGAELGGGFRATIELADPMFIKKINNTIGISFGIDFTQCRYCRYYRDNYAIWSPVALQWNFFFTRSWSGFAEFGGILRSEGAFRYVDIDPAFWVGTRIHFNNDIALTFRLGYPMFSVGVSFFVGS